MAKPSVASSKNFIFNHRKLKSIKHYQLRLIDNTDMNYIIDVEYIIFSISNRTNLHNLFF